MTPTADTQMSLPQGDVRLLHTETAQRLLGSKKLRTWPDVAITVDVAAMPPELLLLRGCACVTNEVDHPGVRMARIAVRPAWVGVLDFTTRFPGGGTAEQFAERGR